MTKFIDNLTVENLTTMAELAYTPEIQVIAATTVTLTATNNSVQIFTGTTAGQILKMPSALTIPAGSVYRIYNQSNQTIALQDNAGNALLTLSQTSVAFGILHVAGSAAGTWIWYQVFINSLAAGILNYQIVSSTAFASSSTTDVLITSFTVTPQAGTYAIWANIATENTSGTATNTGSVYRGAVQIADTERAARMAAANSPFALAMMTVATFTGSQACDVRVRCSAASQTVRARTLLLIRLGS